MSNVTDAWLMAWDAQTEHCGVEIYATVEGVATNKKALLTKNALDQVFIDGGAGEKGGFELQMLESDFSGDPVKTMNVTANGAASGATLSVIGVNLNNGVYYITVGDFSVE